MQMSKTPGTFAYPGSKTTYANWIIEHIPEHHLYVEPFGGAASVLVAKPRSDIEVYNDINGDCVDFFKAVRDRPDELERWVEHTPYSRELFEEYVEAYPEWPDDLVERAGRFLTVQNASFGGKGLTTDNPTFQVRQMPENRSDRARIYYQEERLQQLAERFKGVYIEQLDYAELIEKYDLEGAFFYFDQPYVDVGDDYYQVEDGGFNHKRFVDTLHDMDGKWLVSYDQNLPSGLDDYRTVSREKVATMSAQTPTKTETLTMNYDIDGEAVMSELGQSGLNAYQ
jgi:DNA adenine methylase